MDSEAVLIGGVDLRICRFIRGNRPRRSAETEAVIQMLCDYFGCKVDLSHDENGAPFIAGCDKRISISHSKNYAGIAVSQHRVGVDVEEPRAQLRRVAERVLSVTELSYYGRSDALLLEAWTLKEALYKAASIPGLDFRRDIVLPLDGNRNTAVVKGEKYDIVLIDNNDERCISLVKKSD